jgi:hypothetical protein
LGHVGALCHVVVATAELLWAENRDVCGPVNRETLRCVVELALARRVELRDDVDADLGTALDQLLEPVGSSAGKTRMWRSREATSRAFQRPDGPRWWARQSPYQMR